MHNLTHSSPWPSHPPPAAFLTWEGSEGACTPCRHLPFSVCRSAMASFLSLPPKFLWIHHLPLPAPPCIPENNRLGVQAVHPTHFRYTAFAYFMQSLISVVEEIKARKLESPQQAQAATLPLPCPFFVILAPHEVQLRASIVGVLLMLLAADV
eukprot:scaffold92608_cov18-Tisochrysis_lutea.AAC.1